MSEAEGRPGPEIRQAVLDALTAQVSGDQDAFRAAMGGLEDRHGSAALAEVAELMAQMITDSLCPVHLRSDGSFDVETVLPLPEACGAEDDAVVDVLDDGTVLTYGALATARIAVEEYVEARRRDDRAAAARIFSALRGGDDSPVRLWISALSAATVEVAQGMPGSA